MPQDAKVWHLWDDELRTEVEVEVVYLSRSGKVVTSDFNVVCYTGKSRPVDAPTEDEDKHWSTPKNPNPYSSFDGGITAPHSENQTKN